VRAPRAGLALLFAALVGVAGGPSAWADPASDTTLARDLFREGAALAQQGKWDQALNRYARSLKLKRSSLTLYSLGVAQKQTGRFIEARESFKAFFAEPSSAATQPFEQAAKAAIEELDARIGRLTIQVTPTGVPDLAVELDGARVAPADIGVARPINPGVHVVTASSSGQIPSSSSVTVRDGEALTVALTLRAGEDTSRAAPPPPPSPPDRTIPLVLMGTGFSTFTVGLAVGMIGVTEAPDAPSNDGVAARHARSKALIGDIIGGGGILMAGVGLVLLLTTGGSKSAPDSTDVKDGKDGKDGKDAKDAKDAKETKTEAVISPWAQGSVAGVRVRF
jgi:hypothetical protein